MCYFLSCLGGSFAQVQWLPRPWRGHPDQPLFFGALHPYFSSVCLAWTGLWAGAKTKQKSNSKGKQKNEPGGNAAQWKRGEWAGQRPVSRIDQKKVLTAGQKSSFFCPLCWPECRPEKSLAFFLLLQVLLSYVGSFLDLPASSMQARQRKMTKEPKPNDVLKRHHTPDVHVHL